MKELILWISVLLIIYSCYEFFVVRKEKAFGNMLKGKELAILKNRYNLDYSKHDMKKVVRLVAITNAFIMSTAVVAVYLLQRLISNLILWGVLVVVVGFIILLPMILFCYGTIGKGLAKKQRGK